MRLLIRPQARLDLLEIWHHIAPENRSAADRLVGELEVGIRRIVDFPGIGHQRRDVPDDRYRFYSVQKYVIAYRMDGSSVVVVRVVHGARDFRKLFRKRP